MNFTLIGFVFCLCGTPTTDKIFIISQLTSVNWHVWCSCRFSWRHVLICRSNSVRPAYIYNPNFLSLIESASYNNLSFKLNEKLFTLKTFSRIWMLLNHCCWCENQCMVYLMPNLHPLLQHRDRWGSSLDSTGVSSESSRGTKSCSSCFHQGIIFFRTWQAYTLRIF